MRPGRRIPFTLETVGIPPTQIEQATVFQVQIAVFPRQMGLYPLKQFDQLELYWGLWDFPDAASYVDLTLIGFRGFLAPLASGIANTIPGYTGNTVFREFYSEVFLALDATNELEIPNQARIRKTAADPTLFATDTNTSYRMGSRHSFPIEEDHFGFLIQTDGDDDTGSQSLWGILGSE